MPDDSRSRATLSRMPATQRIDTSHFSHRRASIPEEELRNVVGTSPSYADVMRGLGMEVNDTNHRRIGVLVVVPDQAGRTNRTRLHQALTEIGVPYACAECGNTGQWLGRPRTLQIDHVSGNWRDSRRENLRYLCPNCHALTETWFRRKGRVPLAG